VFFTARADTAGRLKPEGYASYRHLEIQAWLTKRPRPVITDKRAFPLVQVTPCNDWVIAAMALMLISITGF